MCHKIFTTRVIKLLIILFIDQLNHYKSLIFSLLCLLLNSLLQKCHFFKKLQKVISFPRVNFSSLVRYQETLVLTFHVYFTSVFKRKEVSFVDKLAELCCDKDKSNKTQLI